MSQFVLIVVKDRYGNEIARYTRQHDSLSKEGLTEVFDMVGKEARVLYPEASRYVMSDHGSTSDPLARAVIYPPAKGGMA